jgi:hypothetical protein
MRADKFHENAVVRVIHDVGNQAILVPADIEDDPVVANKVDVGPEGGLDLVWLSPAFLQNQLVPPAERPLRPGVFFPELPQRSLGHNLHVYKQFPFWEQALFPRLGRKVKEVKTILVFDLTN